MGVLIALDTSLFHLPNYLLCSQDSSRFHNFKLHLHGPTQSFQFLLSLKFTEIFEYGNWFVLPHLDILSNYFLQNLFLSSHFSWKSNNTYVRPFDIVLPLFESLFIFLYFFCLLKLDNSTKRSYGLVLQVGLPRSRDKCICSFVLNGKSPTEHIILPFMKATEQPHESNSVLTNLPVD